MSIYSLDSGYIFIFYTEEKMKKFSDELSETLLEKLGNAPDQICMEDLLQYAFEWCTDKLTDILNTQTELRFYQAIFLLHEFSCHFTTSQPKKAPIPAMDEQDYALYRRTLKLCLEHACELNLSAEKSFSLSYLNEIDTTVENILYWGANAYNFSNLLAEEKMCTGSTHFRLEAPNGICFRRNSSLEFFQMEMLRDKAISSLLVSDKSCFSDFVAAAKNCLGIEYEHI